MRARRSSHKPLASALGLASLFCVAVAQESPAQPPTPELQEAGAALPQTRSEVIDKDRAEKLAELWPERQNALVDLVNGFAERGLKEGLDSGKGANGLQFILGGMRAKQGVSYGVGYRRSDFFRDHLGYRATARGSIGGAYKLDVNLDFQGTQTEQTYLRW